MSVAVVCGALAGLGLVGLGAALRRRRPSLAAELAAVTGDVPPPPGSVTAGLGAAAGSLAGRLGLAGRWPASDADLDMTGVAGDDLAAATVLAAAVGAVVPGAAAAVAGHGSWLVPAWVALAGAAAGGAAPGLWVRRQARAARAEAVAVLAAFLDLVVLGLAGGMGIEGALHAAGVADHPFARRLAAAVERARHGVTTPWRALEELGRSAGVDPLVEVAAALELAGTQGARVRAALAARAASLRRRQLAEAEAAANAAGERLFVPGVVLLAGFVVFLAYPALSRLTTGL